MIERLSLPGALIVCDDMRALDAACIRAVCGREPGEWFAVDRWETHGVSLELLQDGAPWAIGGLAMPNQWTAVLWMVARPGLTGQSWRKLLRKVRTLLALACDPAHPEYRHRVEAHVLEGWEGAAEFVRRLGFELEHTRKQAGRSGENVQVWVRLGPVKG